MMRTETIDEEILQLEKKIAKRQASVFEEVRNSCLIMRRQVEALKNLRGKSKPGVYINEITYLGEKYKKF